MVRRYDHFASEQFNCYSFMEEVIDGDYVTYDDYQKLKASHAEYELAKRFEDSINETRD